MPFFSVIIPLYNKALVVTETLQSVINQTFTDYEIIIVNDGSTDNSLEVVSSFLKTKNSIDYSIISQNNKGLSATRNTAIKNARGTVISLLDADDIWEPNYLEEVFQLQKKHPELLFYATDYLELYSNSKISEPKKNLDKTLKQQQFIVDDFFKVNLHQNILCPSSFSFKKEVFKDFKFNESITFTEDVDFYIRVFLKHQLAYNYKPLVKVRLDQANQMTALGLKNKTITDLNSYEHFTKDNKSLKQYLDFKRYQYASQYKQIGNTETYNELIEQLDFNNLTAKQRFILKSPDVVFNIIKQIKKGLLKLGIKWSSY